MRGKVLLQKVIFYVKLSLSPTWCWPLSKDASRLEMTCVKLYHYLSIILAIMIQLPLIYSIKNHHDDFLILVECILELSSTTHSMANFIFHRINKHHIQYVSFEMIHFSEVIKPHEDIIIQRYIDNCIILHGACILILYMGVIIVIIGVPIVMNQPFPMLAEYPFNVYYQPLKSIIYLHHSVVGVQASSQLCSNIFMTLLLWFAIARFEILTDELRKTTDVYHLVKCIRKHQYLLKYATEITLAARPFALTTICCSTVSMIIVCVLLITNQSWALKIKYVGFLLIGLSEVFIYTWPAEHLIYRSQDVAQAVFDMPWYDKSIEIRKCLQIIIERSQKPVIIAITGIMPTLSLSYFASYCSTVLSFFTTIRAFVNDEK